MREVKEFRAWHKTEKRFLTEEEVFGHNLFYFFDWVGYEIEQYTGKKDKNGKKIYTGDCFGEKPVGKEAELIGTVIFDNDFGAYCVKYTNGGWSYLYEHLDNKKNHLEIIGNIHENTELLA